MGTITAQDLVSRSDILTNDTGNVRWTTDELLMWVNDAQRQVVLLRPDASTSYASKALSAGTVQTLPAGHLRLIDAPRNTNGRAVRMVDRGEIDRINPDWHLLPGVTSIVHFMYDPRDPKRFLVYPPAASAGAALDLVTTVSPVDCANLGSTIGLDDIYAGPILDGVLYRALSKNAKGADPAKAAAYLARMQNTLGVKLQIDTAMNATIGASK